MTALQVAKVECANCDSAGNCAGVGIADDLSCYTFRQPVYRTFFWNFAAQFP